MTCFLYMGWFQIVNAGIHHGGYGIVQVSRLQFKQFQPSTSYLDPVSQ